MINWKVKIRAVILKFLIKAILMLKKIDAKNKILTFLLNRSKLKIIWEYKAEIQNFRTQTLYLIKSKKNQET